MRFGRLHVVVTYLIAGAGLLALSLGDELGLAATGLMIAGFFASIFVGPATLGKARYTSMWNFLIVGFLALQVARAFTDTAVLQLGIEFAAALQIAKLFHRVGARDYQHIQALSLLHLVAATVLTTGFEYALIFVVFVIVLPWMLALTHLRGEIEIHYVAPESKIPPGLGPPSEKAKEVLRSRRIAGAGFLGWTAALSIPLFLVTAAFFTLFPRVGMGFLSLGENGGRTVAGFGPDVQLGGFGVIRDDPTVVLRVTPSDHVPGGVNNEHFRLRGTSFDRYEEARWSRSDTSAPDSLQELMGFYQLLRRGRQSATRELDIVLDPLDEQVLFLPPGAIGVFVPPRVEAGRQTYRRLDLADGWDLRYRESDGLELRYSVAIDESMDTIPEQLESEDVERYLQLPEGSERIAGLAREIAGSGPPREQVQRLQTWLRSSGTFEYTLNMPDTRGRDPLEVFLFDARRGHCEYFSSALAVMLRSLGVPSRNVTGFVGGVYNRYGGYYSIRQGDAHSWIEAYVDGAWRTYDPTPAAHMSAAPRGDGLLADIRAVLDAMRMRWALDVVGYDLRDQVEGLRAAFRWFRSFRQDDTVTGERGLNEEESEAPVPWMPLTGAALFLLGLAYLVWRRRRKKSTGPKRATSELGESARDLYERLERRLAKRGIVRPKTRTPREHLARLEAAGDAELELARAVTEAYEAGRLGGESNQDELRALKRRL
ncbi:MAG: DUF3488 and DUF4129 domain-containing transglutaminase family protein [Polyangiales bacterium]